MERCCPQCMRHNPAYWCLTKAQTTAAFALPLEDMKKIRPIFVTILSEELTNRNIPTRGFWAYPIKRILDRALEVYGSIEAVKETALEMCAGQQDPRFADVPKAAMLLASRYNIFRAAQLEPLGWAQANSAKFLAQLFRAMIDRGLLRAAIAPDATDYW
ncbi:hypothetical protein N7535_001453 [Penicillium sp. DV-2018c]|nr:hypothetical protein N7461_005302 [Penicillium sp. DV-2018c]KAJ5582833.1 hypothetical protein N7535_001453 [Penicillium sp. DV-2018c]